MNWGLDVIIISVKFVIRIPAQFFRKKLDSKAHKINKESKSMVSIVNSRIAKSKTNNFHRIAVNLSLLTQ